MRAGASGSGGPLTTTLITTLLLGGCIADNGLLGTGLFDTDRDNDGVKNGEERDLGLDPKNADSDADGLSDGDELEIGSDPLNADSDGDGLLDGQEAEIGSDPMSTDSDGDGYLDPWEVAEGTDPADYESRIYQGFWPYNPNKDAVKNPNDFPLVKFKDQHGDLVDPMDFALQGKYIVIDVYAQWCGPCNEVAGWLDGENSTYDSYGPDVVKAINKGEAYWLSIMIENNSSAGPSVGDLEDWTDLYPNKNVPVLGDKKQELFSSEFFAGWYPSGFLVDENFKRLTDDGYIETAIEELQNRL
jgi:thiol-disulfide isomerase/thioredoxin